VYGQLSRIVDLHLDALAAVAQSQRQRRGRGARST